MTTIYLVTQGSYSDYRIVGAYSTRELADKVVTEINRCYHYDQAVVEELELDKPTVKQGYARLTLRMDRDGNTLDTWNSGPLEGEDRTLFTDYRPHYSGGVTCLTVSRFTDSLETLAKIANELRTRYLAEKGWPVVKPFGTAPFSLEN